MASKEQQDLNYWPSFVDIFASLFFIFLILFSIFYIIEVGTAEAAQKDIDDLKKMIMSLDVKMDPDRGKLVIEENVLFGFNEHVLKKEGKHFAQKFAQNLSIFFSSYERQKKYAIVIEGHTDTRGSDEYNNELSIKRAINFINEIEINLNPSLRKKLEFIPAGFGETMLAVSTKDEIREDKNRRVVVRIMPKFDATISRLKPQ